MVEAMALAVALAMAVGMTALPISVTIAMARPRLGNAGLAMTFLAGIMWGGGFSTGRGIIIWGGGFSQGWGIFGEVWIFWVVVLARGGGYLGRWF